MRERKKLLMKAVVLGLATLTSAAIPVGFTIAACYLGRKTSLEKADIINTYRMEELEKVQNKFDNGEINQSEFDIKVSYINGLQNYSITDDIIFNENSEHKDCCRPRYIKTIYYDVADIGFALGIIGGCTFTVAPLMWTKAAIDNYCDYKCKSQRSHRKNFELGEK